MQTNEQARVNVEQAITTIQAFYDLLDEIIGDDGTGETLYELMQILKTFKDYPSTVSAIGLYRALMLSVELAVFPDVETPMSEALMYACEQQMLVEGIDYEQLVRKIDWMDYSMMYNVIDVGGQVYEFLRNPFQPEAKNEHGYALACLTMEDKIPLNTPITMKIILRNNRGDEVVDEMFVVCDRFGYGMMCPDAGACVELSQFLTVLNSGEFAYVSEIRIGDNTWSFEEGEQYIAYFSEMNDALKNNIGGTFEVTNGNTGATQSFTVVKLPMDAVPSSEIH